ncbi:MAG: IPT/TIG domain-containing protein [Acidobacteriota bacterium]
MRRQPTLHKLLPACLLLAVAALFGCDAESPTDPVSQEVAPPPVTSPPNGSFSITVQAAPDVFEFEAGLATSNITVTARRADGSLVPRETTGLLTTTAGTLIASNGTSGARIPIVFDETGQARATLNVTAASALTVTIRAQLQQSFGSDTIRLVETAELPPFQVSGISPAFGPPSGGTPVTIFGSGFESPARVTFTVLGQELLLNNLRVNGSTQITGTTPAINLPSGQNATASILVESGFTASGAPTASDLLAAGFTYTRSAAGPTTLKVISLSPTSGPNEGGTQVTIRGEGFTDGVQVYFTNGPLVEATVLEVTPTRLEVVTPAATGFNSGNANMLVDVRVVDPSTGQQDTLVSGYQYGFAGGSDIFISSIRPSEGEYLGGDLVTIFGQGFEEPVAVEYGTIGQPVLSVTGTEIVTRNSGIAISCSPVSGAAQVVNIETAEVATGPPFTYRPIQPLITGIDDTSGPASGGETVQIIGPRRFAVGFVGPVRVRFGDATSPSAVASADGTFVSAVVPTFSGDFNCGDDGFLEAASVDVEVINLDTGCSDVLTNAYTYDPGLVACDTEDGGGGNGGNNGGGNGAVAASFTSASVGFTTVQFTDTSTSQNGNIAVWGWDFGDGFGSLQQNPSHTYAVPGTYTVSLTVVDSTSASGSVMQDVTVP